MKRVKIALSCLLTTLFPVCFCSGQVTSLKIIPKPTSVTNHITIHEVPEKQAVYIDPASGLDQDYIFGLLADGGFVPVATSKPEKALFVLKLNKQAAYQNNEAYKLSVFTPCCSQIVAEADARPGLHYAVQTFRQIIIRENGKVYLPACTIIDRPAFPWREFMLDVSRQFKSVSAVKGVLDEMARLKMNIFHFHLTDNQSWRIEIKKYPKLTEIGSKGNQSTLSEGIMPAAESWWSGRSGDFYTQEQIREIVQYAAQRDILVVPEIEMPAHVTASVYSYNWLGTTSKRLGKYVGDDQYDVTDPKVETFWKDVLSEIASLFPSNIIHIGQEETNYWHWEHAPWVNDFMKKHRIPTYADLQVWFINRVSGFLASKGYRAIMFNEINITGNNNSRYPAAKSEKILPDVIIQFWLGDVNLINRAIEEGHAVVNSDNSFVYLNYDYVQLPLEKVYSFNPIPEGVTDTKKILGIGSHLWTGRVAHDDVMWFQVCPRIAAIAETGWTPFADKNYDDFRLRLKPLESIWKAKGYIRNQIKCY